MANIRPIALILNALVLVPLLVESVLGGGLPSDRRLYLMVLILLIASATSLIGILLTKLKVIRPIAIIVNSIAVLEVLLVINDTYVKYPRNRPDDAAALMMAIALATPVLSLITILRETRDK